MSASSFGPVRLPSERRDYEPNPVYEAMRQESRDAPRVTEMQRFTNCSHQYGPRGVCRHCADDEPRRDAW